MSRIVELAAYRLRRRLRRCARVYIPEIGRTLAMLGSFT